MAQFDPLHRRDQLFVGRGREADLAPALDDDPVDEVDLGAPTLLHVLSHRRALVLAALLRVPEGQHQRFDRVKRGPVAFRCARQRLGILAGDVFELVARRLTDPHRLATEGDDQIAQHADEVIEVPRTEWMLAPLLAVIPLQLLAYHIARRRGLNVAQPRNLAKTVTVE